MYLANIVSETNIDNNGLFNITNNLNNIIREIPTLIIGWDLSKRLFSDRKLSILEKKIDNNISWTFSKREKRIDFEKDLDFFVKNTFKSIEIRVKYKYINILTAKFSIIKKLIKKLTSNEMSCIYIHKNAFIYIFIDNKIIGIDFNFIDFLNIDRKKVYRILYSNGNDLIFSYDFLPKEISNNLDNNYKIIPYLQAIKNDKCSS